MNQSYYTILDTELVEQDFISLCQSIIQKNSKSFDFASRFLPSAARADAAVLYAWCRHVDDSIDEVDISKMPEALEALHKELNAVYALEPLSIETQVILSENLVLSAFRTLVKRLRIPKHYPLELIKGMRMDVEATQYIELSDLYLYCYRVARVVGLMMCYVLRVNHPQALLKAAYLGLAMQLTNICRDVNEDWARGRLYLPLHMLCSGSPAQLQILSPSASSKINQRFAQNSIPSLMVEAIQVVTSDLLKLADQFYQRGFSGLKYLPWQSSLAIHAAGLIYRDIGRIILAQSCDPNQPRAVTSKWRKVVLSLKAIAYGALSSITRLFDSFLGRKQQQESTYLCFQDLLQDIIEQQTGSNQLSREYKINISSKKTELNVTESMIKLTSLPQQEERS